MKSVLICINLLAALVWGCQPAASKNHNRTGGRLTASYLTDQAGIPADHPKKRQGENEAESTSTAGLMLESIFLSVGTNRRPNIAHELSKVTYVL